MKYINEMSKEEKQVWKNKIQQVLKKLRGEKHE